MERETVLVKKLYAVKAAKIFRIVKERYRCHKLFFDNLVVEIACRLHNFRLPARLIN
jgi:hypothetical protein